MVKNRFKTFSHLLVSVVTSFIMLLTVMVAVQVGYSMLKKTQPVFFGYTVSKILTSSMVKSGFNVGDVVISKVAKQENLAVGDVISFYVHKDGKPILEGENRDDSRVIFHEIIEVSMVGNTAYYKTKGTSNSVADKELVPYQSLVGKYIDVGGATEKLMTFFLGDNNIFYMIVICAIILAINSFVSLLAAVGDYQYCARIEDGKMRILSKRCLEGKLYKNFTKKQQLRAMDSVPWKLKPLYEFLIFGKVTDYYCGDLAKGLRGKRVMLKDMLALTHYEQTDNREGKKTYIINLPNYDKKLNQYISIGEMNKTLKKEELNGLGTFLGAGLFLIFSLVLPAVQGLLWNISIYQIGLILVITIISGLYFLSCKIDCMSKRRKMEEYCDFGIELTDCYGVIENFLESDEASIDAARKKLLSSFGHEDEKVVSTNEDNFLEYNVTTN